MFGIFEKVSRHQGDDLGKHGDGGKAGRRERDVYERQAQEIRIGGGCFQIIAGPCSVESEEQICAVAESVKKSGATMLRGGAFKPRTSPYAFQGLRGEGIRLLLEAKKLTGMPIVTEIMDISQLPLFDEVDVIQVGARNMQNFELDVYKRQDIFTSYPAEKAKYASFS